MKRSTKKVLDLLQDRPDRWLRINFTFLKQDPVFAGILKEFEELVTYAETTEKNLNALQIKFMKTQAELLSTELMRSAQQWKK